LILLRYGADLLPHGEDEHDGERDFRGEEGFAEAGAAAASGVRA
jgi:hypothetical protein